MAHIDDTSPLRGNACHFCGNPATAYWNHKNGILFICETCAREALPKLLADSLTTLGQGNLHAEQVLTEARAGFYYAMFSRANRMR